MFSEFLFTFFFCPSTPVIYDAVGIYQKELTEEILDELNDHRVKVLFGSDYMVQDKLKNAFNSSTKKDNQIVFVNDLSDFSKLI